MNRKTDVSSVISGERSKRPTSIDEFIDSSLGESLLQEKIYSSSKNNLQISRLNGVF